MDQTQYITRDAVQDITGQRRVTMADAISLAEARLLHSLDSEPVIEDVTAKRLNNSDGWAVTFTFTPTEEDLTHLVTILGGTRLYCTVCDKTVADLVGLNKPSIHWNVDAAHQRECFALIAPDARPKVRLIY